MTPLVTTLLAAGVGGLISILGMMINSWLTQGRERSQHLWEMKVTRIQDLEERAGEIVELISNHGSIDNVQAGLLEKLRRLQSDAGRFLRHKGLALAIRDLHNGIMTLMEQKARGDDFRATTGEVDSLFRKLLGECDKVTG